MFNTKRILKIIILGALLTIGAFVITYAIAPDRVNRTLSKVFQNFKTPQTNSKSKVIESGIWGIDISHHQRNINWKEIALNKPDFVFLKSTEGSTHVDSKYAIYRNKFEDLSILTGAYHFFSYSSDGRKQALHFLKNSNLTTGNLLPVLDVEFKKNMSSKQDIIKNINLFIATIMEKTGSAPLIYCEYDYYKKYLKGNLIVECEYWISDFWREPRCTYVFWQQTDKFEHAAFKGTVDYNTFNGSYSKLNTYTLK